MNIETLMAEGLRQVRARLEKRFPRENPAALDEFAQGLHGAAVVWDVPLEHLFEWISHDHDRKDWSVSAWRLWCDRYAADRDGGHRCRNCQGGQLMLTRAGVWTCAACGVKELEP